MRKGVPGIWYTKLTAKVGITDGIDRDEEIFCWSSFQ